MEEPDNDVIVFRSLRATACRERALVLRAMGIEHIVRRGGTGWRIVVPEHRAHDAIRELEAYERENRDWPPRHPRLPGYRYAFDAVVLAVIVLLLVGIASWRATFGLDWFGAGRVDSDLVRQGEWWRSLTALTLHSGVQHLVGNLVLGSLLVLVASRTLGGGLACFSIVIAGAVGNEVSALLQPSGHRAVGASTAVFAALGLVGAFNWRHRHVHGLRWAVRWSPLVVAAIVLASTGSGGPRTDVFSHLTGFLVGVALGAYYGGFKPIIGIGPRSQLLFGLGTLGAIAAAWAIALTTYG